MSKVHLPRVPTAEYDIDYSPINDHDAICSLLTSAELPPPAANEYPVTMLTAKNGLEVVGCIGWELHEGAALLRSLVVSPADRRSGVGAALVESALRKLRRRQVERVFLITKNAQLFASRFGFREIDRSCLPESCKVTGQIGSGCCAAAACMSVSI